MDSAPNSIDIQDSFQFKLHCRLKIFKESDVSFKDNFNLVAAASRFGLVFVGTTLPSFQVLLLKNVEDCSQKSDPCDFLRRTVQLPSKPTHLSINCDSTQLCVIVQKESCPTALIYDVPSFSKQQLFINKEIRLSSTPNVTILECSWNPTIPNILTVCKSDKSLGVYEFKETGIDINEIPPGAGSTCMCWSPKGKQLAVGSQDGKITQYKPDLKAVKVINAPPLPEPNTLISLQWISNYQFIGVYCPTTPDSAASLIVIDAPKSGETKYTNYEDICYSYGNTRGPQFYMIFQPMWNLLMVSSSNSMEVGVLGFTNNQWHQWILADAARAELPLNADRQETLPVGLALDTGTTKPMPWGDSTIPAPPLLYVLSHHGVLCCFSVVNLREGAPTINQVPENLPDSSGLSLFVKEIIEQKQVVQEAPPPRATVPQEVVLPVQPPVTVPVPSAVLTPPKLPQLQPQIQPHNLSAHEPVLFTSKPSQPSLEIKSSSSSPQIPSFFQQPVAVTPRAYARRSASRTQLKSEVKAPELPPLEGITQDDSEETQKLVATMVREECKLLQAELKEILHKGRSVNVTVGLEHDGAELVRKIDEIQNFLDDVSETSNAQAAEVHYLKQQLIQTWVWYEDAKSRYATSQDETVASLLRAQPLDPASQHHLANISHLMYYLESQLGQVNNALDEQWENFQDSCKKTYQMQVPTLEKIFQSMVRQNATLQKQKYKLKDIQTRLQAFTRKNTSTHVLSLKTSEDLEKKLESLKLEPPQNLFDVEYDRVLNKEKHLSSEKLNQLRTLLKTNKVTHVAITKPEIPALPLTPHNKVELQPSKVGELQPKALDFAHSTPRPQGMAVKSPSASRSEVVFRLTPKEAKPSIAVSSSFGSGGGGVFVQPIPVLATTTPSAFAPAVSKPSQTFSFTNKPQEQPKATAPSSSMFTQKPALPQLFGTSTFSFNASSVGNVLNPKPETPTNTTTSSSIFSFKSAPVESTVSSTVGTSAPKSPSVFGNLKTDFQSPFFGAQTPAVSFGTGGSSGFAAGKTVPLAKTTSSLNVPGLNVPSSAASFSFNVGSKSQGSLFGSLGRSEAVVVTQGGSTSGGLGVKASAGETDLGQKVSQGDTTPEKPATFSPKSEPTVFGGVKPPATATSQFSIFNSGVPTPSGITQPLFDPSALPISTVKPQFSTIPVTSAPVSTTVTLAPPPSPTMATVAPIIVSTPGTTTATFVVPTTTAITSKPLFSTTTAPNILVIPKPVNTAPVSVPAAPGPTNLPNSSAVVSSSPSVTSVFGKTASTTSIFGAAPDPDALEANIFGAPQSATSIFGAVPPPNATTSIFGATPSATSIFGAVSAPNATSESTTSIFGAPPAAAPSGTSIFGATSAPSASPSTTSIFGAAPAATTAAVASTTSIFGTAAASSAGSTTSVFGAAAPAGSATGVFGAPSSLSGGATSVFKVPAAAAAATTTKVQAATSSVFDSGVSSTSVTSTGPSTSNSVSSTSIFAQPPSNANTAPKLDPLTSSAPTNMFGAAPVFGAPVFGEIPTTTAAPAFGSPPTFGSTFASATPAQTTTTATAFSPFASASVFQTTATAPTTTNAFAASQPTAAASFGSAAPQSQMNTFSFANANVPSTTAAFGMFGGLNVGSAGGFGGDQGQAQNPFGRTSGQEQKVAFGGGGSIFGSPSATPVTGGSIFGGGSSGSPFSGSGSQAFGTTSGSAFGGSPAFGQTPAFGQSAFGSASPFGGGSSIQGSFSAGNQSVAQAGFGAAAGGSSGFGVGAAATGSSGFGAPPVFGSPTQSGFGAPASFGGSPGFGSQPAFGGIAAQSTFSSPVQQQSSSFANLANQNTLGFGSLAQQSQPPTDSNIFSKNSSFSSWR